MQHIHTIFWKIKFCKCQSSCCLIFTILSSPTFLFRQKPLHLPQNPQLRILCSPCSVFLDKKNFMSQKYYKSNNDLWPLFFFCLFKEATLHKSNEVLVLLWHPQIMWVHLVFWSPGVLEDLSAIFALMLCQDSLFLNKSQESRPKQTWLADRMHPKSFTHVSVAIIIHSFAMMIIRLTSMFQKVRLPFIMAPQSVFITGCNRGDNKWNISQIIFLSVDQGIGFFPFHHDHHDHHDHHHHHHHHHQLKQITLGQVDHHHHHHQH